MAESDRLSPLRDVTRFRELLLGALRLTTPQHVRTLPVAGTYSGELVWNETTKALYVWTGIAWDEITSGVGGSHTIISATHTDTSGGASSGQYLYYGGSGWAARTPLHTDLSGITASQHHAKYTDAEAITAVEGEATLDLTGDVTIAAGKKLAMGSAIQNAFVYVQATVGEGAKQAMAFHLAQTLGANDAAESIGMYGAVTLNDAGYDKTGAVIGIRGYILKGGVGTATLLVCQDAYASVAQGTATDLYLYRARDPASGGLIVNLHAIYIEDMTGGSTLNIAIHQVGNTGHNRLQGNTKMGADSTPTEVLDVAGNVAVSGTVDGVDVSVHDPAATGVHGAGGDTLATDADITTHAALSTGVHGAGGDVLATDADIATHAGLADEHHAEAHAPESHTGTDITAAELETLSDGSDADALHDHLSLLTDAEHTAIGDAAPHHVKYLDSEAVAAAKTVKLDDFATPDDNTDLNFSTTRHGLTPKGPDTGKFLKDDGSWDTPAGGDNDLTPAPGSDHTSSGVTANLTAGEAVVFGDFCYVKSDGKMWKADADAIATAGVIAMANATISADASGSFLLWGFARDDTWAWTVGGLVFLSTTTGAATQTAPSGTDDVIQILGMATHADRMLFKPELVQVEHT